MSKILTRAEADCYQLSQQLKPIDERRFDAIYEGLWISSADNIGYNGYDINCKGMVYLDQCYALVFQAIKGYQVIRRILCETRTRICRGCIGERASEISQLWITPEGEKVELKKPKTWTRLVAGWRHDYWATKAQFRVSVNIDLDAYLMEDETEQMDAETVFVDSLTKSAMPILNALEFSQPIRDKIDERSSMTRISHIKDVESIIAKIDEKKMKVSTFVPSILVATRHKYDILGNIDKWLKLVSIMSKVDGADLHNPIFVCPQNIDDCIKMFTRKLEKQRIKEAERKRKEIAMAQKADTEAYRKNMRNYLCIAFDTETLQFHVLQDVAEFYEEANAMHHCVYRGGYYRKFSSLILSCTDRKTGKRVSTIEIDLKTMRVMQNYAACDKVPANDKEIRRAISDNMYRIENAKRLAS